MSTQENKAGGANNSGAPGSETETPEQMAARLDRELKGQGAQPKAPEKGSSKVTKSQVTEQKSAEPMKYFVSPGKSITSKKGILGPHTEVKAEYVNLPTEAEQLAHLNRLVEKGTLYRDVKPRPKLAGDNEVKSEAVVERPRKSSRSPRSE